MQLTKVRKLYQQHKFVKVQLVPHVKVRLFFAGIIVSNGEFACWNFWVSASQQQFFTCSPFECKFLLYQHEQRVKSSACLTLIFSLNPQHLSTLKNKSQKYWTKAAFGFNTIFPLSFFSFLKPVVKFFTFKTSLLLHFKCNNKKNHYH